MIKLEKEVMQTWAALFTVFTFMSICLSTVDPLGSVLAFAFLLLAIVCWLDAR